MQNIKDSDAIPALVNIPKLSLDTTYSYELNKETSWIGELLTELNENAENKLPEEYFEDSFINVDLNVTKRFKGSLGEFLIVSGSLTTEYYTQCVRTLEDMKDSLEVEFKTCLIDMKFEQAEEFADQTEIFEDNDVHELYFFEKNKVDIKEMIHEQIFLHINQYPTKDGDTPLGWTEEPDNTKH